MITTTVGLHNITCKGWCAFALLVSVILLMKLVHAVIVWRSLSRTGIAFLPKASRGIRQLPWLEPAHKEEVVKLLQAPSKNFIIPMKFVPGHVELVKEFPAARIEVEVIGSGSCTVLFGLKHEALKNVSILRNLASLAALSQNISETKTFEKRQRLTFSIPETTRATIDESGRHPVVVFLRSLSTVEVTFLTNTAANMVYQFLLPADNEALSIVPIFSQNVDECMVCYDLKSNVVILDCRHCCICTDCMQRLRDCRCIVCRHRFNKFLYLPRREINV
jgi:hypothetical protein